MAGRLRVLDQPGLWEILSKKITAQARDILYQSEQRYMSCCELGGQVLWDSPQLSARVYEISFQTCFFFNISKKIFMGQ